MKISLRKTNILNLFCPVQYIASPAKHNYYLKIFNDLIQYSVFQIICSFLYFCELLAPKGFLYFVFIFTTTDSAVVAYGLCKMSPHRPTSTQCCYFTGLKIWSGQPLQAGKKWKNGSGPIKFLRFYSFCIAWAVFVLQFIFCYFLMFFFLFLYGPESLNINFEDCYCILLQTIG